MKSAADSPFVTRLMEKGIPESLVSDPEARIFYDPPEIIQRAFGGRQWFWEQGCTAVHRVGLFLGLGWSLPLLVQRQDERGIDGVRIRARKLRPGNKHQLFDIEFVKRTVPDDHMDGGVQTQVIDHRPGLTAEQLKPAYAEVLGEHAV